MPRRAGEALGKGSGQRLLVANGEVVHCIYKCLSWLEHMHLLGEMPLFH